MQARASQTQDHGVEMVLRLAWVAVCVMNWTF